MWTITNTSGRSLNTGRLKFTMTYAGRASSFRGSPDMDWSSTQSAGTYVLSGGSSKDLAAGAAMTIEFTFDRALGAPANPQLFTGSGTGDDSAETLLPTATPEPSAPATSLPVSKGHLL
jgi:hypothetical protein